MTTASAGNRKGKAIAAILLAGGILTLIFFAVRFVHFRMKYAVTDAVFVRTDSLASLGFGQVAGKVISIAKNEGDPVAAGEIIGKIDDTSYRLAAKRIEAEKNSAAASLAAQNLALKRFKTELDLDIRISISKVKELEKKKAATDAEAASVQAVIDQLVRDKKRYDALYESRAVSKNKSEEIITRLVAKKAEKTAVEKKAAAVAVSIQTARLKVMLANAKKTRIAEIEKNIISISEKIHGLEAALKNAQKSISDCTLKSTITGRIARRYVAIGDVVSPANPAYAVMDPKDIYVVALLEENKLNGVLSGNAVTIHIDAYPGRTYKGVVDHVLPASAATFALAPRDISAGEFTKVAQRIPVRIKFTDGDISLLRVGLSGKVEILRKGT
ncbi:MAG: HlyD family efflux transporter periplasmic adaptor subunit [Deltaproteobacteria bacterium]|nr:HlyD family efflux transporter periplasmic adaptor subunit [Deltaproteobacteria bacterium]